MPFWQPLNGSSRMSVTRLSRMSSGPPFHACPVGAPTNTPYSRLSHPPGPGPVIVKSLSRTSGALMSTIALGAFNTTVGGALITAAWRGVEYSLSDGLSTCTVSL